MYTCKSLSKAELCPPPQISHAETLIPNGVEFGHRASNKVMKTEREGGAREQWDPARALI